MTLLTVENLSASIAGKTICKELSFTLKPGDIWVLLGANGAGKTTLIHTLAGLRDYDQGKLLIHDRPIEQLSRKQIAQSLGVLFQDNPDHFPATVLEATLIGRHPHISHWQWESAEDKEIALKALKTVGMEHKQQQLLRTLSGGEHKRVEIATLLTQNPHIFLLDEPINHLDLHYQSLLLQSLTEHIHRNKACAMMSLHDINIARRYCNHALLLFEGGEVQHGSIDAMFTTDNLSRLYNHPIQRLEKDDEHYFIAVR